MKLYQFTFPAFYTSAPDNEVRHYLIHWDNARKVFFRSREDAIEYERKMVNKMKRDGMAWLSGVHRALINRYAKNGSGLLDFYMKLRDCRYRTRIGIPHTQPVKDLIAAGILYERKNHARFHDRKI